MSQAVDILLAELSNRINTYLVENQTGSITPTKHKAIETKAYETLARIAAEVDVIVAGGPTIILPVTNVSSDVTFNIPAGHTLLNCIVSLDTPGGVGIAEISMGDNAPNNDNIVPQQPAVIEAAEDNTITVGYSAKTTKTVTIKAVDWENRGIYSFYFTLIKYK